MLSGNICSLEDVQEIEVAAPRKTGHPSLPKGKGPRGKDSVLASPLPFLPGARRGCLGMQQLTCVPVEESPCEGGPEGKPGQGLGSSVTSWQHPWTSYPLTSYVTKSPIWVSWHQFLIQEVKCNSD